jgi:pimeloyl-ACP methyl ester carboxylesterase
MADDCWVETPKGRIFAALWHSVDASDERPPIVLFHDSLGCVALWRDFPLHLSQATGRRVIAYDRLGFGRSDPYPGRLGLDFVRDEAETGFAALRVHLGLERFVLFGHSVGGAMAVVSAGRDPENCAALVTESAQAFVEDRTREGVGDAKRRFSEAGQIDRLRKYHGDNAEWVLNAWTETWLSEAFRTWTLDDDLPRVSCPTLAIHGEFDEYASVRHPERIAASTAGPGEMEIIPGCGHVPHRETPDAVVRSVASFLSRAADPERPAGTPKALD